MAAILVKNAYAGVRAKTCQKGCPYFLKYYPVCPANEGGKYSGVCICAKTGEGTGPRCQPSS
ncbi:MAG: hypothetical protein PHZ04_03340 [Patescibacteria group bacterium]|nr:hypothetical protein [Patescibacteria group bacterium]MDD5554206.1 hypothetical protein [Patescibacteria group bacterium]